MTSSGIDACKENQMVRTWLLGSLLSAFVTAIPFSGRAMDVVDLENELSDEDFELYYEKEKDRVYKRVVIESEYVGANEDVVRYKEYRKKGRVKANIIFMHGRAEFIEKYDPMFTSLDEVPWETQADQTLADLPFNFYTIDHAGQGLSEGMASHIDSYDIYVENVYRLIHHVKGLRKHKKPLYIMAHSMGALVAVRFAQQYPEYVDGLILTSPMFGIKPPPGVSPEQLRQLVSAYAAPQPMGFGLANKCAGSAQPIVLGSIAQCFADASGFCASCFMGDRAAAGCNMIPVDWQAMDEAWALLNSDFATTCEKFPRQEPEDSCTFPGDYFNGTTSDYAYCHYTQSHTLSGPYMTFGWLFASYLAIDELFETANLDMIRDIPTLVLSSPIDPISVASSHGKFCSEMEDCELVNFESNFETGPIYFHEILVETDRASVIAEIRDYLESRFSHNHHCF